MTFDTSGSATDTTTLDFTYTVASADESTEGIAFYANKLSAGTGVTIRAHDSTVDANLDFAKVDHDSNHKVDGVRPTLSSAIVSGTALTLTYSETLDSSSTPDADDFTVEVDGSAVSLANASPVAVSGSAVTLTLASAVTSGLGVTVSYTADTKPIQDAAGNDAANLAGQTVSNGTNTAPSFSSSSTVPSTLSVQENSPAGTAVGTVAATDAEGDELTYSLTSAGTDHDSFAIGSGGAITVATGAALDFESHASYAVTVQVTDSKAADGTDDSTIDATHDVTINLTNVEEPPAAPAAPTVTAASVTSLKVTWAEPSDSGAKAVTDYDVRYQASGASEWTDHAHTGTGTTATITGLAKATTYSVQVRAEGDGEGAWSASGSGATGAVAPTVSSVALVSTPATGQNGTYKLGDTVRARVTFDTAVDVTGSPLLKLQLATDSGEKDMTFDTSGSATDTTTLDFTYTVASADESTQGIAFYANKLSLPANVTIRAHDQALDADLGFAKVDHNNQHKVDGVRPDLAATNPVRVSSSAGTDNTYAIGDHIAITAKFAESVTVTAVGNPVTGPRIGFTLGTAAKQAAYDSGSGTEAVFRYTVAEDDTDADGIELAQNALALNGGAIKDAAGNAAGATQLEHAAVAKSASHKVDGVRPKLSISSPPATSEDGSKVVLTFDEDLDSSNGPANSDFTVKVADSAVTLTGSAATSGKAVTLTLATAATAAQTVTASYTDPTTGNDASAVQDAAGNDVASFADEAVTNKAVPTVTGVALTSAPGVDNTYAIGGHGARDGDVLGDGGRGHDRRHAGPGAGLRRDGQDGGLRQRHRDGAAGVLLHGCGGRPGRGRHRHRGRQAGAERRHDPERDEGRGADARGGRGEREPQGGRGAAEALQRGDVGGRVEGGADLRRGSGQLERAGELGLHGEGGGQLGDADGQRGDERQGGDADAADGSGVRADGDGELRRPDDGQ